MLTNRIRVFRNCSYYTGKCMFELSYLLMTSSQHRGALTLKANRPSSVVLFQFYCEKSSPSLSSLYPWWVMVSVRQVVVVVEVQKKHKVVSVKTEITIFVPKYCKDILQAERLLRSLPVCIPLITQTPSVMWKCLLYFWKYWPVFLVQCTHLINTEPERMISYLNHI